MSQLDPLPTAPLATESDEPMGPELELECLWERGGRPDVRTFVASYGHGSGRLELDDLVAVLRVDQRRRWLDGERVELASYLAEFPRIAAEPEAVFELLYNEILIREELGEHPDPEDYARAFPELAGRLRMQMEVHAALSGDDIDLWNGEEGGRPRSTCGPKGLPSVPGYELIEELGRGGMGVVYRARQLRPSREVALKMVLAGRFASDKELRRFANEAEAVAALEHPNIVPILEVGQDERRPFFSMRLLPGGTLADAQARLLDDPKAVARLLIDVAGAVHHAHQRGILHRDLKPANILLDEEGRPYVTDFGLAKWVHSRAGLTETGQVMGSPEFMAPEQAVGETGTVTTATDVYGLGAILYALLTGQAPFGKGSVREMLSRLQDDPPEAPSRVNRRVPKGLELICLKCLEKRPERRYPSAEAFADDVQRWLNGEPVLARRVPTAVRMLYWVRRHPTQAVLAGMLAAVLVTGVAGMYVLWQRAEASLGEARRQYSLSQIAATRLQQSYREQEAAREREKQARLRAEQRFDTALKMVENFYRGTGENTIQRTAEVRGGRRELLRRAIAMYKELQASLQGDESIAAKSQLAASYTRLGALTTELDAGTADGSAEIAMAAFDKAIEIRQEISRREPDSLGRALDVCMTWYERAWNERLYGRYEDSLRSYQKSYELYDELTKRYPGDSKVLNNKAWSLANVGTLNLMLGRAEASLELQKRVLQIRLDLVALEPQSSDFKSDMARVRTDIGIVLSRLGRLAEASASLEEAIRVLRGILHDRPGLADPSRRLAAALNELAEVRHMQKQYGAMAEASAEVIKISEGLAKRSPRDLGAQENYARDLYFQANRFSLAGEYPLELERRCTELYESLIRSYPGVTRLKVGVARAALLYLGDLRNSGRSAEADPIARRAIAAVLSTDEDGPGESLRREATSLQIMWALCRIDQGKVGEAQEAFRSLEPTVKAMKEPEGVMVYNVACLAARLAEAEADPGAREEYTDRAIEWLRRAIERGYGDVDYWQRDRDLKILRDLPEYQALLLDSVFPKDPFQF